MSSILIKGMDMPKSCADCFFRQAAPNSLDVYFCYADKNNRYAVHDKRPLFCPLVEVPTPHGDLIDKDLLLKVYEPDPEDDQKMKEESLKNYVLMTKIVDLVTESINKMPIVIKVEE